MADYSVLIKSLLLCILTSFERSLNQMKKHSKAKVATGTEILVLMQELLGDIYDFHYAGGQM